VKEVSPSNQVLRLLFWETTIRCNLSCAHCRRLESDDKAFRDLSTAQAKNLIGQLAELGRGQSMIPMLVFSGGEPLCRKDLFELVGRARTARIIPALATNGTLINAAVAERIRDSGIVRVAVSLDGATAEVHNKLRKLQGSFENALEGISHLRDKNVPFQINITLTKHNAHQLADVYELAKSLGAKAVHIFMLVPVGCGQVLAETDMLSAQQYEQMLLEIYRLDSQNELQVKVTCGPHYERVIRQQGLHQSQGKKGLTAETAKHAEKKKESHSAVSANSAVRRFGHRIASKGCLAGLGVLFVGHQGDVFPCGYLPVKCGNVLEQKLADIWRDSEDLARMRDVNSLEGKCGLCDYRWVCGGCRARAYAATGNYMAEEPFCAYSVRSPKDIPPEATH
jgi:radical SAM protein with 4Fe4S-binding SPASM domain